MAKASMAGPEDEKRAINAGYQVHLSKPIDAGELSTIASALIDRTND